jgi:hypothetical protein
MTSPASSGTLSTPLGTSRFIPAMLCVVALVVGVSSANLAASGSPTGTRSSPSASLSSISTPAPNGYWQVASDGGVFAYGGARFYGSTGALVLNRPVVGMAATPDGHGYWLVASDGGVFAFGDAQYYGSTGDLVLNRPVVGMAATSDGHGYWLVGSDGGVFAFGDAIFFGSTGNVHLNRPVVDIATTPDGHGYWLAASDGGVFTYGDAAFHGSAGGLILISAVGAIDATPSGQGYRLAAGDGGVFCYGDAAFQGSAAGQSTRGVVVALASTPQGTGYWLTASDGGVFAFGDAPFFGSAGALLLRRPIVGITPSITPEINPLDYTIAGDASGVLLPGTSSQIDLRITNPNDIPLTVVSNTTTVTTSQSACDPSNFTVAQGFSQPVMIPARTSTTLSQLGIPGRQWPTIGMLDTHLNQDVCMGATLTLHYSGVAVA